MRRQSFSRWFAAGVLSSAVLVPSAAWGQGAPCPATAVNGSVSSGCALAANGTTASGNAQAIGTLETETTPPTATAAQPGQVVVTAAPTQPSLAPTPTGGVALAPTTPSLAPTGGVALAPTTPSLQPQIPSLTPLLPAPDVPSLVPQLTLAPAPLVAALQASPQATPAPTSSSASSGSTPSLVRTGGSHQDMAVSGVLAVVIGAALVVIAQARRRPVQAVASS